MRVTILGSGMAGVGAVHRLAEAGAAAVVYDKNTYPGGHTVSHVLGDGFVFDEGPHVSFTGDDRVRELFADSVEGEFRTFPSSVNNYWQGHWIKHPAQCNLHGLPTDLVVKILCEFVEATSNQTPTAVRHYEDWLVASFGRTFAETFPMQYTVKYHTTQAANMTTDWLGPRLYQPELAEVFRGALTSSTPDVHYIKEFRYPTRGGFFSYVGGFLKGTEVHLSHEAVSIDPEARTIRFSNGASVEYEGLVSSIPLPDLIPMVHGAPEDVLAAADRLACTVCVLVNVAIDRADVFDAHWSYFYDDDVFFTRLSCPSLLSPNNAPPGTSTLQAECYYSDKYRPLDGLPVDCVEPVVADLRRCGLIRDDDTVLLAEAQLVPYANVIFDHDRQACLDTVHGFLDDVGIGYGGRYGEWDYYWTDDSFKSGERAAQRVLDSAGRPV